MRSFDSSKAELPAGPANIPQKAPRGRNLAGQSRFTAVKQCQKLLISDLAVVQRLGLVVKDFDRSECFSFKHSEARPAASAHVRYGIFKA